jgi:hypothetical protein
MKPSRTTGIATPLDGARVRAGVDAARSSLLRPRPAGRHQPRRAVPIVVSRD